MPNLIGIAGRKGSGKSTLAQWASEGYLHDVDSFAETIRMMLRSLGVSEYHLTDQQGKEEVIPWLGKSGRELMLSLGTAWGRDMVMENIWVNALIRRYTSRALPATIVDDVRFANEAHALRSEGGIIVEISRPGFEPGDGSSQEGVHPSEWGIPPELVDVRINSGDLPDMLSQFQNEFGPAWE